MNVEPRLRAIIIKVRTTNITVGDKITLLNKINNSMIVDAFKQLR